MTVLQQASTHGVASDVVATMSRLSGHASALINGEQDFQEILLAFKSELGSLSRLVDYPPHDLLHAANNILAAGVDRLLLTRKPLSQQQCAFLTRYTELLSDYIRIPESRIPAKCLIRHLRDNNWIRPLNSDEISLLDNLVAQHDHVDLSSKELDEADINEKVPVECEIIGSFENNRECMISKTGKTVDGEIPDSIMQSACDEIEQVAGDDNIADSVSNDNVLSLDDVLNIAGDHVPFSGDDSGLTVKTSPAIPEEAGVENKNQIETGVTGPVDISTEQHDLIELVCGELSELVEYHEDMSDKSGDDLSTHLEFLAEQAANIGNALKLIGLKGLFVASEYISRNLHIYAQDTGLFNNGTIELLVQWPHHFQEYLNNIGDAEKARRLYDYLTDARWRERISDEKFIDVLKNPALCDEEVEQRQTIATEHDIDLSLPDDVNRELLDAMLHELPSQTEMFSAAIQNLSRGGTVEDIEVAQRVAHTLKGAANVVGINGIASLTHHLEDILECHSRAGRMPGPALTDVLVTAADCIEGISESILGMDSPPQDLKQILQNILDWANRLDKEGIPDNNETDSESESAGSVQQRAVTETEQNNAAKEQVSPENMLRVSAVLAEELLRLAGENLISTGQVQERIKNILKGQDVFHIHNQSLQQIAIDLEYMVDVRGMASVSETAHLDNEFDSLEMDNYSEIHSISRRLVEVAADSIEITNVLTSQLSDLQNLVINQRQIQKENQELVLHTRMVPTRSIVPRLKRGVRQACRITNKQVDIVVEDNETCLDSEVLNELVEPLMHILRNAVDHGIESAAERVQQGKAATGLIRVNFVRTGDRVVISIEDDGRGIDPVTIRAIALKKGLITDNKELTDGELLRVILEPGFTTRGEVSQVSGRGIGLNAVNVKLREQKGSINIFTEPGKGCRFEISLPVSSFSTHSLLVRVRQYIYTISNRGVVEILHPGVGELITLGNETVFRVENEIYNAIHFDSLFNLPPDRRKTVRSTMPVVIVREESGAMSAILVQSVLDSTDVVVKSMGQYIPKINGIVGAAILGDGSVSPVVDLPELLEYRNNNHVIQQQSEHASVSAGQKRKPYVLVVDDSLSARQSLCEFVSDLGYDVRSSRDGMEAVSLIEARSPDMLLVDMEMPKMNGLELASHVRSGSTTAKMPIIMITSRSTQKHRKAARDRGINHIMMKPFAEDELAMHINSLLENP